MWKSAGKRYETRLVWRWSVWREAGATSSSDTVQHLTRDTANRSYSPLGRTLLCEQAKVPCACDRKKGLWYVCSYTAHERRTTAFVGRGDKIFKLISLHGIHAYNSQYFDSSRTWRWRRWRWWSLFPYMSAHTHKNSNYAYRSLFIL